MSDAPLPQFPATLLHEIYSFLWIAEQQRVSGVCRALWDFGKEYNGKLLRLQLGTTKNRSGPHFLKSASPGPFESFIVPPERCLTINSFVSLQSMDLGPCATNGYLFILASNDVSLPSLQRISMTRSKVDDYGLHALSNSSSLASTVEEVDITFCRKTTYQGTFCLRRKFVNLKLLRRQPAWMDGKFETPFSSDETEIHTYWPDGSFQFSRDTQSSGFVCDLQNLVGDNEEEEENFRHVCDKLQYHDFEPPGNWPDWTRLHYRPGVALLRLDDEVGASTGEVVQSVLVAQYLRGLRPPTQNRGQMEEAKALIPLGESRYFFPTGTMVPSDRLEEAKRTDNLTLISRMRLIPFNPKTESLLPPEELVAKNEEICNRIHKHWDDGTDPQYETLLHVHLGGDPLQ